MTDTDKVFALTELMGDVIHALELRQYDIEDPQLSHECVTDANKFHQRMIDILHGETKMCCYPSGYLMDEINGECPNCGEPTVDGDAYKNCTYSPIECNVCGRSPCDGSC